MMTFQDAVEHAATKLSVSSDNTHISNRLDAQILLCHACNVEQSNVIAHPEKSLTATQLENFQSMLNRRTTGEPLAYIIGKKEFWSLNFNVNQHVLIPRPETELLVERALRLIEKKKNPRILDLGTGSGAIAISIKNELNNCEVIATDISLAALEVARQNAKRHNSNVVFIHSDWYEELSNEKFDVIVCNPPYIAQDDPHLDKNVARFEPHKALTSNNNGLFDLEIVISKANNYLEKPGNLIVEHGFQQAKKVQQLFNQNGFTSAQTLKDLAGLDRVTLNHT